MADRRAHIARVQQAWQTVAFSGFAKVRPWAEILRQLQPAKPAREMTDEEMQANWARLVAFQRALRKREG